MTARLIAADGPVCLGKSGGFDVKLRNKDTGETWTSPPRAYCGTGFAVSLPLYPALLCVALLDVFDGLDRYDILDEGHSRNHELLVVPQEGNSAWVQADGIALRSRGRESSLPPGRYELRLELVEILDPRYVMSFYPAPLFWRPFDHPVSGVASFVVEESMPDY
ncbi:MAG: hypothetical protein IH897_16590 [Planctomycetes bacterium]|nr:hypothetical protein [Planctomycetota bacterium]